MDETPKRPVRRLDLGRHLHWPFHFAVWSLVILLVALWGSRLVTGTEIDWPATFSSLASGLTSIAIVLGGWWTLFVLQRRRAHETRAELKHAFSLWTMGDRRVLRLAVTLRNCGEVPINPGTSHTSVQLQPTTPPEPQALAEKSWRDFARIEHRWADHEIVIEPGETETYYHDVVLQPDLKYVQVSTVVACENGTDDGLNWDEVTLVDLERLANDQGQ
jgi:hypothetical protein